MHCGYLSAIVPNFRLVDHEFGRGVHFLSDRVLHELLLEPEVLERHRFLPFSL